MSEEDFDEPLPLFSCRLCAGESDSIVHIYNDSVTGDDLAEYIHAHLPIRVSPEDSLPLYCCTGCAQTVFDFHRLVADCVCAESLLLQQFNNSLEVEEEEECNDAFDHTYVDVNVEAEVEAEDEGGYESPEPDDGALVIVEEKIDIVEEKAVVVEEKAVVVEKEPVVVQKKVVVVREEASADIDSKDLPSEEELVSYTIPKPDPNRVNLHEEPRFVCTKCGKSYKSRSYLNIHVNKVHAEPPAPFKDKIKVIKTGKEFTYEVDEENIDSDDIKNIFHELTENVDGECTISFIAEDTKRYKCDHCALTYSRKYLLRRHIERDHPEHIKYADKIKELYCDYCDDKFAKMELLLEHVRYSHPGEELPDAKVKAKRAASAAFRASCQVTKPDGTKQFKCPECAKCYPTGQSFTNHMVQHRKEAKYCCHICGKRFRMFSSFDRHVRYFHNQERNYECTICDRRFSNPRYRDDHMNIHLDRRPYVCDVCGKSFRQTGGLYIHKLHHNKDESTFKYQCTVCGKKFRRTDALMVHNRIHNGEKPFHCTSCGRDFRLKTLLVKHQATHRDTNAFVCKDCGANFSLMRFLTAHKQKTCKKKRNTDATKKVSK